MGKARREPWYRWYGPLQQELHVLQTRFNERCTELSTTPSQVLGGFFRGLVASVVRESNWTEGIKVGVGRTREIADHAFDHLEIANSVRLDLGTFVQVHRKETLRLLREGIFTPDDAATLNLSRAHLLLNWIAAELQYRQTASLAAALRQAQVAIKSLPPTSIIPAEVAKGFGIISALLDSQAPAYAPLNAIIGTEGELLGQLLEEPFDSLLHPMHENYLHTLHTTTMMGIATPSSLGRWRQVSVNVGNPDVVFPPPEVVPAMMHEYCSSFPTILPGTVSYDPILTAAKWSHKFVRIHPYTDGNGRLSRLIMNLILWGHYPPVALSAKAKGRHRYRVALRRADRGQHEPLACLIAISIRDTYLQMLDALGCVERPHYG